MYMMLKARKTCT